MQRSNIFRAWGRILFGDSPVLAIEITNRCPLACPGCYAYSPGHVNGLSIEDMSEFAGDRLVGAVLSLVDHRRPLGLFIVGGEPLVRYRELDALLPQICARGVSVEIITSAVRPIPPAWADIPNLTMVISVDGPREEHDARRKPATYDRILKHIEGHEVVIHCTVTRRLMLGTDRLERFLEFWSDRPETRAIRVSLYTPQIGETSEDIMPPEMRKATITELERLHPRFPKLRMTPAMVEAYLNPPNGPQDCIFSQVTDCLSPDLQSRVQPCQLGGTPDCQNCGCVAAVGLQAVANTPLIGGLKVGHVFRFSERVGRSVRSVRMRFNGKQPHLNGQ
jgi:MoaA/NifB/PqqE/SkfB family radical SAM enzyme